MSVCALPIVQVDSTNHTITTKEYVCRSKNGTFFLTKCLFNSPSIEPVLLFERRKELQKGLAIPVTFNNVRCDFSLWTHNAWKALVPIGAQRSATLWVTENRMELLKHRTKFSAPWGWVGDFYNMPPPQETMTSPHEERERERTHGCTFNNILLHCSSGEMLANVHGWVWEVFHVWYKVFCWNIGIVNFDPVL